MSKPIVLITTRLPAQMHKLLENDFELVLNESELSRADLLRICQNVDGVVSDLVNKYDEEFFVSCPRVKVVANIAVGYDNIDIKAAIKHGVLACNTPGVLTDTTADLAFVLLMAVARRVTEAERYLRNGQWQNFALDLLLGIDIHKKTVGIVGMGRIGQAFARRAAGFDMKVLYTQNNKAPTEIEKSLNAEFTTLPDLLSRSDFVSIHCPLNDKTRGLIGRPQFEAMKRSAFLINTARGAVIHEQELVAALKEKLIAGAGLDVFSNEPNVPAELLAMDNVVLLPHFGSATIETRSAMARLACQAVLDAFQLRQPRI